MEGPEVDARCFSSTLTQSLGHLSQLMALDQINFEEAARSKGPMFEKC